MLDHKSIDKKKWRREDVSEKYKLLLLHDIFDRLKRLVTSTEQQEGL